MVRLIVPCYNEADRWDESYWQEIGHVKGLRMTFVNDGSVDATADRVSAVLRDGWELLQLLRNVGKAEEVRAVST